MDLNDIANYCEFTNCTVTLGSADGGSIDVDGGGVTGSFNAYRRFLAHHEMSALSSPAHVLKAADRFTIVREGESTDLSRVDFEMELRRFQDLVGT